MGVLDGFDVLVQRSVITRCLVGSPRLALERRPRGAEEREGQDDRERSRSSVAETGEKERTRERRDEEEDVRRERCEGGSEKEPRARERSGRQRPMRSFEHRPKWRPLSAPRGRKEAEEV